MELNRIHNIDALEGLKTLQDNSIDCVVTSPPYWALRDYGVEGQLGLEPTFQEYITKLCDIFDEVQRVLKKEGTCWVNLGDSYSSGGGAGTGEYRKRHTQFGKEVGGSGQSLSHSSKELPPKNLCNIPARFSIEMQNRGWILRNRIIWHKANVMPSSVNDRFTVDFEEIFFFVKNKKYWFEQQFEELAEVSLNDKRLNKGRFEYEGKRKNVEGKIQNVMCGFNELGRNKRTTWFINPKPFTLNSQTYHWKLSEQDVPSDGNLHIVLPNCPLYGGLFDLLSSILRDGHEGDKLNYILNNYFHLSQEPKDGYVAIEKLLSWNFGEHNLGLLLLDSLGIAIDHNNEKNKTGLFVLTNLSCKPSSERLSRIERILTPHGLNVPSLYIDENNIFEDGFPDNQKPHTLWSIVGKSDFSFSLAEGLNFCKYTKNNSHFAVFPEKLIQTPINAGCPKDGIVLDPFMGSGTTAVVAKKFNRNYLGFEINKEYIDIAENRLYQELGLFI